MKAFNLRLKEGVDPAALKKYGFAPKFDENTGEIIEYRRPFYVYKHEKHFSFVLRKYEKRKIFRYFCYDAWLSGFDWSYVASDECLQLLFSLVKDDIVEICAVES